MQDPTLPSLDPGQGPQAIAQVIIHATQLANMLAGLAQAVVTAYGANGPSPAPTPAQVFQTVTGLPAFLSAWTAAAQAAQAQAAQAQASQKAAVMAKLSDADLAVLGLTRS